MTSNRAVLLILTFFCLLPTAFAEEAALRYKIGVVLGLTGPAASFANSFKIAVDLALEDLPDADRRRVRVLFEDDGLSNLRAVSAGKKLLDIDKVDALITWSSGTALSLVSVTESRKVPHKVN